MINKEGKWRNKKERERRSATFGNGRNLRECKKRRIITWEREAF